MKILPIDFMGQGALIEPKDRKLHDMAVDYCLRELKNGQEINLSKFNKVWIAIDGEEVKGIMAYCLRADIPLYRATSDDATHLMAERLNSFFADNGCRGEEVFVHVSKRETEQQKCPAWREVMIGWEAESADRFSFKVR